MKKILLSVLAFVMLLSMAACSGKDYTKHTFTYLGEDFHWDMTVDDAKAYLQGEMVSQSEITVDVNETYTIVRGGDYIFRFAGNGPLEFVKVMFDIDDADDVLEMLQKEYGAFDEEDEIAGGPWYRWFGTMDGKPSSMGLDCPRVGDFAYLEFSPEE